MFCVIVLMLIPGCIFGIIEESLPESNIAGGNSALRKQLPYHVPIVIDWWWYICSGTIISPSTVLTCASCFKDDSAKRYKVIAGITELGTYSPSRQVSFITSYKTHPDYQSDKAAFDIALAFLDTELFFTEAVQRAVLPKARGVPSGFATVAGWGSGELENHNLNRRLQYLKSLIISADECSKEIDYEVEKTNLCTKPVSGTKSIFNKYIGDGLVQDGIVIGVASQSMKAASIFVKVSAFVEWITSQVQDL